ncbi:hypothetical protein FJZ53_03965 [Candidatus Woesearchaeota archaeon]|nr:hypothetical protein [Candidatus Woesearchaeota archaeon]
MLRVKTFQQTQTGYCGPASLKMVLAYFGVEKSEKQLARLTRCSKKYGSEAEHILSAVKTLGFKGLVKDFSSFDDIRKFVINKRIPVIVDWFSVDDGHYSVVVGIDKKSIHFNDPENGKLREMSLKKFKTVWFDFPEDFLRSKKDLRIRRMLVIYK